VFVGYTPLLNRCVPRPTDAQLDALTDSGAAADAGKAASMCTI
jgi:hypothetical protein